MVQMVLVGFGASDRMSTSFIKFSSFFLLSDSNLFFSLLKVLSFEYEQNELVNIRPHLRNADDKQFLNSTSGGHENSSSAI